MYVCMNEWMYVCTSIVLMYVCMYMSGLSPKAGKREEPVALFGVCMYACMVCMSVCMYMDGG
jgi:hypothetical protein